MEYYIQTFLSLCPLMEHYIKTFLSLCLLFTIVGAAVWLIYLSAIIVMAVFPYSLAVVLGALSVVAFVAWRRNYGH